MFADLDPGQDRHAKKATAGKTSELGYRVNRKVVMREETPFLHLNSPQKSEVGELGGKIGDVIGRKGNGRTSG